MCLAIPGKLVAVREQGGIRMGTARFGEAEREVSLAFVAEAEIGDHVLVHAGFALERLTEQEAAEVAALQQAAFETS